MPKGKLNISKGNKKLGKIPNFSKMPIKNCGPNAKYCKEDCYAVKFVKMWKSVRQSWSVNGKELAKSGNYRILKEEINGFLSRNLNTRFFRIHVSGDFENQREVLTWFEIARDNPDVKFLACTKAFDLDYSNCPPNLTIVFSMFPNMPDDIIPEHYKDFPIAWTQDKEKTETRIPDNAIDCPGYCDSCAMCWHLPNLKKDVFFDIH